MQSDIAGWQEFSERLPFKKHPVRLKSRTTKYPTRRQCFAWHILSTLAGRTFFPTNREFFTRPFIIPLTFPNCQAISGCKITGFPGHPTTMLENHFGQGFSTRNPVKIKVFKSQNPHKALRVFLACVTRGVGQLGTGSLHHQSHRTIECRRVSIEHCQISIEWPSTHTE